MTESIDRRAWRRMRAALFALVWFSCAWFGSWEMNPNNAVRLFAAVSLAEQGDATIDEFAAQTIDKAQFDGHYYSDKAPGMTLTAVPAVWLTDVVTGQRAADAGWPGTQGFIDYLRLRQQVAVAIGPAILTAIAAVLLFDLGTALSGSAASGLAGAIGFALATPVWGWSTTLLGHAPVADLLVIALWATWRNRAWAAGLALGWAVVVEHQAILAGGAIGVWALLRWWRLPGRWRRYAVLGLAGTAALLPLVAYNQLAFGTPFRVAYSGVVGWEGMHQGLFGLTWPRPDVLRAITVGRAHGLIWVAPVVLVAPFGLYVLAKDPQGRGLAITAAAVAGIALLVNAAYVYWEGGNTTGPRIALPAIAGLAVGIAPVWPRLRGWGWPLLALSVAINAAIASAEIFAAPVSAFPLWTEVVAGRFYAGDLRTVASMWFGWTPWQGFVIWALVAGALAAWLAAEARAAAVSGARA